MNKGMCSAMQACPIGPGGGRWCNLACCAAAIPLDWDWSLWGWVCPGRVQLPNHQHVLPGLSPSSLSLACGLGRATAVLSSLPTANATRSSAIVHRLEFMGTDCGLLAVENCNRSRQARFGCALSALTEALQASCLWRVLRDLKKTVWNRGFVATCLAEEERGEEGMLSMLWQERTCSEGAHLRVEVHQRKLQACIERHFEFEGYA